MLHIANLTANIFLYATKLLMYCMVSHIKPANPTIQQTAHVLLVGHGPFTNHGNTVSQLAPFGRGVR